MQKTIAIRTILFLYIIIFSNVVSGQSKPGYKLPAYEKFRLSNGLTIYLMEKHDVPVVSFSALIPAGAVYDGKEAGLASITAECLKCGTKSFSKKEIEDQFDFLGASLNSYGSTEFAGLSSRFASKDMDSILPMIKEMLVDAVFTDSEFEKEKTRTLIGLDQAKESPEAVINYYWNKFYYGNNVYGNVVSGTKTSLSPVTASDAREFYKNYYNPDGATIAIVGDFKTSSMKASLSKLFSGWKKLLPPGVSKNRMPGEVGGNRVLLVNKDDAKETTFIIGSKGITRNNPDYVASDVVNTFFGGRFTSWINDELRIKSGLTYGAGSSFRYNKSDGTFILSTHTANATTEAAIDKALEVIQRLHQQPLDNEILTSAKNYMIGLSPPRYQSTSQLAGLLNHMFWYGFDESYINNFEANVNAVSLNKAKEVIGKYFPNKNLQFVLIGKASEIRPIAEKYGKVTEVQLKDDIGAGL